jgi:hypothetical protein
MYNVPYVLQTECQIASAVVATPNQSWQQLIDPDGKKGLVDPGRVKRLGVKSSTSRLQIWHSTITLMCPFLPLATTEM